MVSRRDHGSVLRRFGLHGIPGGPRWALALALRLALGLSVVLGVGGAWRPALAAPGSPPRSLRSKRLKRVGVCF